MAVRDCYVYLLAVSIQRNDIAWLLCLLYRFYESLWWPFWTRHTVVEFVPLQCLPLERATWGYRQDWLLVGCLLKWKISAKKTGTLCLRTFALWSTQKTRPPSRSVLQLYLLLTHAHLSVSYAVLSALKTRPPSRLVLQYLVFNYFALWLGLCAIYKHLIK